MKNKICGFLLATILFTSCGAPFDMKLKYEATLMNKKCPEMIGKDVRLDSVRALPKLVMQYNYTMLSLRLADMDVPVFENYIKPVVLYGVATNADLKLYRDNKVTLNYQYFDKEGKRVTLITITPADYLQQVNPPPFDKTLKYQVALINKKCPYNLDENTRLDSANAVPGNEIRFNYTLVNMSKRDLDVSKLEENARPKMLQDVKTNDEIKIFRDNQTTISYYYVDKNGQFVTKLSFASDQYNN